MGAVTDRLGPSITLAKVKNWLKIDTDADDDLIEDLIEEVLDKADSYLNNDFLDDAGEELDIPVCIRLWVKREITKNYERRANTIQREEVAELGLQQSGKDENWAVEEWGDLRLHRKNPGF